MRKWLTVRTGVIAVLLLTLIVMMLVMNRRPDVQPEVSLVDNILLSNLPQKDTSNIDTSHLASGLTPPTNKWFSGIALQKEPKTVFPMPLGFSATDSTFSYGLPDVQVTASTISGGLGQRLIATVAGASSYKVTRYDELSADLTYFRTDGTAMGTVTLLEGSPYLQFAASAGAKLSVELLGTTPAVRDTQVIFETDIANYYVMGFSGSDLTASGQKLNIDVPANGLVSFYALPPTVTNDALKNTAGNRITGTTVEFWKKNNSFQTAITIKTSNGKPTAYGAMPHQENAAAATFSYATIYGDQRISTGTTFTFSTPIVQVDSSLELSKLSKANRDLLVKTLRQDINATTFKATDSYYSGKELYRSAQMLQMARQLGEDNIASTIQNKLRQQLESWLSAIDDQGSRFFYYDTRIQSLIGATPSFGSEEANDHHFHYGYFIYAASILAQYDNEFLDRYQPSVDLIVADIANYTGGQKLPLRRVFDPYMGHSWASGSSPFNDGNNQESSSEAMNAWIGISLWADQTKNSKLASQAGWLLSNESASTSSYWMNIDKTKAPYNKGYAHAIVSLNWGGKRDYSTFFSAEPLAKLGIQLLPMSPSMNQQLSDNSKARAAHIAELGPLTSYDVPFGDYLLMYQSLDNADAQLLKEAQKLRDTTIDGANSRSYMYAWIMSQP